jgi:hypothetical protein
MTQAPQFGISVLVCFCGFKRIDAIEILYLAGLWRVEQSQKQVAKTRQYYSKMAAFSYHKGVCDCY